MRRILVALILVTALFPLTAMSETDDSGGIVIEEILVSASSEQYNGTDWNGDGDIGSFSDQYIMITNTGTESVDISDWILDDTTNGGSPPCRIGWNTTIEAGESITFYRANTDIELDYWDGDTATLMNADGDLIDSMTYPGEDSWWDKVYIVAENGSLWKTDPNPSEIQGTCFTESDNTEDAYILKGRIVPMTGEGDIIENGNIMIEGSKIVAIWADGEIPPINTDDISTYDTEATIYPGLIDLHNHMHYNHIPLWDFNVHLSDSQKSEEGGYTNRYQWGNNWDYGPSITWMKNNVQQRSRWDMSAEQMKYAEVQAITGGVTAVQGSPGSGTDAWDSMLSRNIELYNFGQDGISTCAVCGAADDDYTGNHLISQNQSGSLNAWFVHLSEGVDQSSKAEFDALWDKGLIMDETVVIHGTGMDASQFNKMGTTGAGLVWSPFSNLVLYGDTTDVVAADNAGITISIAPDWGPSGTKNNLHELKVADMWNRDILDNHFTDYELAEMVTSNPAEISNWEGFVGQLKTDMYADIVVIDSFHDNPYRNLIEAIDPDVRLTIVHGKPVFGDIDLMSAMKGDDWEYINGSGFSKAIDVTSTSEVDGMQTWEEIESGLSMAMRNDFNDIKANWDDVAGMTDSEIEDWLGSNFDGDYKDNVNRLSTLGLDPIYTTGDDRFFDVVNRSAHANYHIDMTNLFDYYNVEYNADGDRQFIEDSNYTIPVDDPDPVEGCTDSTAINYNSNAESDDGSCEFEVDNGEDNPDNNASGEENCVGICDEDVSDQAESDDSDPVFALTVVMVIIFIGAISVIIVSKGKDEIKELAHESSMDDFIPELPPLEPPKD